MEQKLSDLVELIPSRFIPIKGDLYIASGEEGKKCGVCALGGIALIGAPERFTTHEWGLIDKDKDPSDPYGGIHYKAILRAVGVTEAQFERPANDPYMFTCEADPASVDLEGQTRYSISTPRLDEYIFNVNDNAKDPITAVVAALRKYGL